MRVLLFPRTQTDRSKSVYRDGPVCVLGNNKTLMTPQIEDVYCIWIKIVTIWIHERGIDDALIGVVQQRAFCDIFTITSKHFIVFELIWLSKKIISFFRVFCFKKKIIVIRAYLASKRLIHHLTSSCTFQQINFINFELILLRENYFIFRSLFSFSNIHLNVFEFFLFAKYQFHCFSSWLSYKHYFYCIFVLNQGAKRISLFLSDWLSKIHSFSSLFSSHKINPLFFERIQFPKNQLNRFSIWIFTFPKIILYR